MQIHIATESHKTLSTSFIDTHGWHTAWFKLGKITTTYVTGPVKIDQVGTQNLTTFFKFVAS